MCSNCGRLLVGVGDLCPYCGFPRPKLSQHLEDTGVIPRVRTRREPVSAKRIGKPVAIILGVAVCVVALVVGLPLIFRPAASVGEVETADGVIPDQPHAPVVSWTAPQDTFFPQLGTIVSLQLFEPGRFDSEYSTNVLAAATDNKGRSQLASIDTATGKVRWRVEAGTSFSCADRPIAKGIACIYDSQLRILLLDSGVVGRTLPAHVASRRVAVVGDTVLALSGRTTGDGEGAIKLQAFSIDGDSLWSDEREVQGTTFGLSTLGGYVAVTGVVDTKGTPIVHAVESGQAISLPEGSPTPLPGGLIAVTQDGQTRICSATGECAEPVEGTPLVPGTRDKSMKDLPALIVAKGELRAYSASGSQLWSRPVSKTPVLGFCGDQLLVRDAEQLVALDPTQGTQKWQQSADPATMSVMCDGSRVMTFTAANALTAFDIGSGDTSWTAEVGVKGKPLVLPTTGGLLSLGTTWTAYK